MALSNWDTLAVDEDGKPTNGIFVSPLGVAVEFYKNWLYIRDEKAWVDGGRFVFPVVMQVQHGSLDYKDVAIAACRGPQQGVYAAVQSTVYPPRLEEDCANCGTKAKELFHKKDCPHFVDTKYMVMLGCGVYGYSGEEWVGVEEESKRFLQGWIQGSEKISIPLPRQLFNKAVSDEMITAHLASKGQKVSKITEDNIYVEADDHNFEEHIRKIDLSKALRFNQGDMFFADKAGVDVPATPPGAATEPFLTQALKKETPP